MYTYNKYTYKENKRLYHIWSDLKRRCDKNFKHYENVSYCKEWSNFDGFAEWAYQNGYQEHLQIDRINYKGDYEPANCRFVTPKRQQRNKSNNVTLEHNGKKQTIADWTEELGIGRGLISKRLSRGWSVQEALEKEPNKKTRIPRKREKGRFVK